MGKQECAFDSVEPISGMCYFVLDEPVADLIRANESTSLTEPES